MKVLYVMPEYPSVSQTFIANEACAVARLGVSVAGYALVNGAARVSASRIDLICPPPTRIRLLIAALRSAPSIFGGLRRARRERLSLRELSRWTLGSAHVAHMQRAARRAEITHIHAHFLARPADVAHLLASSLNCRWTATAHGSDVYAPAEPKLMHRRLRTVAAVACANDGLRRKLEDMAAPHDLRTAVVHCGVDTRRLKYQTLRPESSERHVITVGRLVATKGHWTILAAALTLMRRDPGLRWTIIGDGPLRDPLQRDRRFAELAPRLTLTGALDHSAILERVAQASAFVLPCERSPAGESDGIPVALMEAMAVGTPVVTAAVGGITELIETGRTGFLVPSKDPEALVAVLDKVLYRMHSSDLDEIRHAARKQVEAEFDIQEEASALLSLIRPYAQSPGVPIEPANPVRA